MTFDNEFLNLGYLDTLSYKDTFVHKLDPRIKLVLCLAFAVTVVSFSKYEVFGLIPFFVFPALLLSLGDIPLKFIAKKVLAVSPFAVFVGIFNPLFDTRTVMMLGGFAVTGGQISFLSIMIKFVLTVSAGLLLIATTSFPGVCCGLRRLGVPEIFVSQLLFLYRYIFVMMEETMKIVRARDMRSFGKRGKGIGVFINIAGVLFIRTIERSERIYQAMLSKGFDGGIRTLKEERVSAGDIVFAVCCLMVFWLFRRYNVVILLGGMIPGAGA